MGGLQQYVFEQSGGIVANKILRNTDSNNLLLTPVKDNYKLQINTKEWGEGGQNETEMRKKEKQDLRSAINE